MKIPNLFNKDSDGNQKPPAPQLGAAALQRGGGRPSLQPSALDSILRRDAAPRPAATPQVANQQDDDPLGRLALGGLRNRPAAPDAPPTPESPPPPEDRPPVMEPQITLTQPELPVDSQPQAVPQPDQDPAYDTPAIEPNTEGEPAPETRPDALAGLEAPAETGAGDDLLDIFRDAREESEDATLVKELDNVPMDDLLTDIVSLSQQLGVTPTAVRKQTPPVVPTPAENAGDESPAVAPTVRPAEPDPEPEPPSIVATQQPAAAPAPEPAPAAPPPQPAPAPQAAAQPAPPAAPQNTTPQSQAPAPAPRIAAPVQPATPPPPAPVPAQPASPPPPPPAQSAAPPAPQQRPPEGGTPRRQLLHVVMIGLSIALAAGIVGGTRGADDLFAAAPVGPTPAVLAFNHEPSAPVTGATATPAPSPAPTLMPTFGPEPTVAPTPTPTPAPTPGAVVDYDFDPLAPAYYVYTVESGDSLTSISREFGVCPDHILWNNGRTENDPLYIGEQLTMPGIAGIVHIVEPGDTITSLAARYSVQPEAIVAFPGNHLEPGDTLRPGRRVLMPGGVPPGALLQTPEGYEATHYPSEHGLVWPYYGPVTTYFGEVRPNYIHYAIDIGGLGAFGQPVVSVAEGKVVFVEYEDPDYGNHVIVDHGDGRRTHYAHFQDVYVAQGDQVTQSQPLGTIGCTGASTGTHLHFELSHNGRLIDPLPLLP